MQINGATLNRVAINGGGEVLPVRFEAEASLSVQTALDAVRLLRAEVQAAVQVHAGISPFAMRCAESDAIAVSAVPALSAYVIRSASGVVCLDTWADLYYTRAVPFYGAAIVSFRARGDVGLVFGEGEARTTFHADAGGARSRQAQGKAVLTRHGDFSPGVIRRAKGAIAWGALQAELDTALIRDGVRIIDGYGVILPVLDLCDNGMVRQSMLGSAEFSVVASGEGRIIRRIKPSPAISALHADMTARAYRFGESDESVLVAVCKAAGEIFVYGDSCAYMDCIAEGEGRILRQSLAGCAAIETLPLLDGARVRVVAGEVETVIDLEGSGLRGLSIDGEVVLYTSGVQDAIINPFAVDAGEQQFLRPSRMTNFVRPAVLRLRSRR